MLSELKIFSFTNSIPDIILRGCTNVEVRGHLTLQFKGTKTLNKLREDRTFYSSLKKYIITGGKKPQAIDTFPSPRIDMLSPGDFLCS